MFLPSITPESESASLLHPAYRALLTLAKSVPNRNNPTRQQLLHKLLREGVFAGFHHASEFPLVVQTLMEHAADIIGQLGLAAVKHLQVRLTFPQHLAQWAPFLTHDTASLGYVLGDFDRSICIHETPSCHSLYRCS